MVSTQVTLRRGDLSFPKQPIPPRPCPSPFAGAKERRFPASKPLCAVRKSHRAPVFVAGPSYMGTLAEVPGREIPPGSQ